MRDDDEHEQDGAAAPPMLERQDRQGQSIEPNRSSRTIGYRALATGPG